MSRERGQRGVKRRQDHSQKDLAVQLPLLRLEDQPNAGLPAEDENAAQALKTGLYAASFTRLEYERLLGGIQRRGGLEDEIAMLRVVLLRLFRQAELAQAQADQVSAYAAINRTTSTLARLLEVHRRLTGQESEFVHKMMKLRDVFQLELPGLEFEPLPKPKPGLMPGLVSPTATQTEKETPET
jgi:hypothetical protein